MSATNEAIGMDFVSGVRINSISEEFILQSMIENIINSRENYHTSITNTESMYYAKRIPEHLEYINSATFSLCDGIGSVIAAKFQGINIKRFNGPDFMLASYEYGQEHKW